MSESGRFVDPIGGQANAWSGPAATGVNGTSNSLKVSNCAFVSAYGHVDNATTLTLQVSADGTNFYDTGSTQTLGAAGDFCINATIGASYVRLKSSNNVNATATITAKDS
jgi:hypothetical protein